MKQKDLLFLLISSAILAGVWIVFTIIHNSLTSTINETVSHQIVPINNSFDNKTVQSLQNRLRVTPQNTLVGTDSLTGVPTPTLAPVAELSPTQTQSSGIITPTPGPTNTPTPIPTNSPTP